ncbi:MAG TPA: hypothetical protein VFA20_10685 [Myxococcaceae bacterium]|nr:hypothetical protein [Myxococcaceae bacterium]
MSNRIAVVLASALAFAAALALACATPKPETTSEPVVKMVTSTVTNQTWFDLANCFGQAPSVPPRASDGVVVGLLQSANPQIMECMTDPRNRGPKERTVITVSTKVPETGVPEHTITSDNITPEGEACIRGVLAKVMPTFTQKAADVLMLPKGDKNKKMEVVDVGKDKGKAKGKGKGKGKGKEEKDTGPVTVGGGDEVKIDEDEMHALKDLPPGTAAALVKFVHDVKVNPTIRGGVNEVSEAAGQIRLALPAICNCFEPWRSADPVAFQLMAVLPHPPDTSGTDGGTPPAATESPATVTITAPETDATAATVGSCVKDHVSKMTFKTPGKEMQVPYNFQFINSASGVPLGSGEGWAKYQQIEEISRRKAAESAIAAGARSSAETLYNQLVTKFQKNNYSVAVKTLVDKCKELLKADDAWQATLQKQLEVEQQKKDVVAALVKEDAAKWADADKASTKSVDAITGDVAKSKSVRTTDEKACPVIKE